MRDATKIIRSTWTLFAPDAVAQGFIRLSAGCESLEDLIEDLKQALDAAR